MAYDGTLKFDTKMDTSKFQSSANKLTDIVKGLGVFKLLEGGFRAVAGSIDAAVARYDTLERFPRILQQMGFSAEDAGAATSKLSDGIQGLPTTLDDVVSTAQRLTVLTGNLDTATDTTLALNNAFLASGSTSADASRGLQQYVQMLSSGKVDMQSWRTLQETMGYALNETAKAFGFAGTSAQNDLYAALQSGEITFDSFNAKLVELDGSVGGFAELAKTATGGIGTAWTNLQTGIVRGTTSIVEAIDEGLSTTRFKSIENIISTAGRGINQALQGVAEVAGFTAGHLDELAIATIGVGTAFATYKAITAWHSAAEKATKVSETLKRIHGELTLSIAKGVDTHLKATAAAAKEASVAADAAAKKAIATAAEKKLALEKAQGAVITGTSTKAINTQNAAEMARVASLQAEKAATEAQSTAETAHIALKKASSAAQKEQNMSVSLGTAFVGYLTGSLTIHQLATAASTAATKLLTVAMNALPFVAAAALIGVVVAGLVKLASWLIQGGEESRKQKAEIEALSDAQKDFAASLEDVENNYKSNIKSIEAATKTSRSLLNTIGDLSNAENQSADDKRKLAAYVDMLNEQQDGLNLSYDKETGLLSMSTEEIEKYINAKENMAKTNALIERQNELYKEQLTLEENRQLLAQKEADLEQALEDKTITQGEYNKRLQELNAVRQEYITNEEDISARLKIVEGEIQEADIGTSQTIIDNAEAQKQAAEEVAAAEEAEMKRREEALGTYTDAATNMFDRINTNSKLSISDMISNLEHNQQAVSDWADNLVILGDRGLDKGLLQQLRDAGPESAATVAAIVNGSDTEISRLNEVFQGGSEEATNALLKTLGLPEVVNSGSDMVDDISEGVDNNPALVDATTKLIQGTKTAADTQVIDSDFPSVGTHIINGITQGVVNGTSSLVNAMVSAVEQAAVAAKKKAKINSPSKLFRDLIGLNIMKGWAQGITQGEGLVVEGVDGTVSALEDSALGTMLTLPKVQMQGFVDRMQAGVEARHAATAAQVAAPRIAAAAMGGVVELSDGSISALRGRGQQSVGAINLTVKALLDGEKVYESVQRVGLERGVQITSGRFDYER